MCLHGIGHLTALGHDRVEVLLLLGGHPPVLGIGLLGDLTGLGQLGPDLGDSFLQALFT